MSTITREWLQQAINDYESVRDELPFGLDDYQGNILAALRIALASLEAKSSKLFTGSWCGAEGLDEPLESKCHCNEDGAHWVESVVYTAPPAPVSVPKMVGWEDVPEEITEDDIALASAWAHGFNQCRAAMLQCADDSLAHEGKNHPDDKLGMVGHLGGSNNMVEPETDNTNQQFESLSRGDK